MVKKKRHAVVSVVCITSMVVLILVALLAPGFIREHIIVVNGSSMYPTYIDGEFLFVNPVRSEDDLEQDHPVCWVRLDSGHDVIKRLIGYPGDYVELKDGDTYVNGELIMERTTESYDNMVFMLGVDEYLFLGDNREDSADGRIWAGYYVRLDNIRGQIRGSGLSGEG